MNFAGGGSGSRSGAVRRRVRAEEEERQKDYAKEALYAFQGSPVFGMNYIRHPVALILRARYRY